MTRADGALIEITPEVLLKAYACGIFPMAEDAHDPAIFWVDPPERGIIPIEGFRVPSRLARTVRADRFEVRVDSDFGGVLDGCAAPQPGRVRTWINAPIRALYGRLFDIGHCHSVETYLDGELVGGLYGVSLGRAFFGESMFSRARDASKVALVHLVARLHAGGFALLDTQFVTDHLMSLGAVEVDRTRYHRMLEAALIGEGNFGALPLDRPVTGREAIEILKGDSPE
jgi:leucyl/phenylalanyl-tRNA---protein transferase